MNTYAMHLFQYFLLIYEVDNSVFALSLWCMECRLMWKKSHSKQFNIRLQHNKTCKIIEMLLN